MKMPNNLSYDVKDAITMNATAIDYIKKHMDEKKASSMGVRLGTKKTGCSGFSYVLEFTETANEDDYIFPMDSNIWVAVDPVSFPLVKGTTLDYQISPFGGVMKFLNPNEKNTCGCGESFTI